MSNRIKKMSIELTDFFKSLISGYIQKECQEEEKTSDLLDLIVSSHISSLFNSMRFIADGDVVAKMQVEHFIKTLLQAIETVPNITKIEQIFCDEAKHDA